MNRTPITVFRLQWKQCKTARSAKNRWLIVKYPWKNWKSLLRKFQHLIGIFFSKPFLYRWESYTKERKFFFFRKLLNWNRSMKWEHSNVEINVKWLVLLPSCYSHRIELPSIEWIEEQKEKHIQFGEFWWGDKSLISSQLITDAIAFQFFKIDEP